MVKMPLKLLILILFSFIIINYYLLNNFFILQQNKLIDLIINRDIRNTCSDYLSKTNIDFNDEFFQIKEVQQQIYKNNLTFIKTISGGEGLIGNALIMLNKLIDICEKIRCQNIIAPGGLQKIIKNPIYYKEYNITIFPNSYINKTKIDIKLSSYNNFYFFYRKKINQMRLGVIREEVFNNIPKYSASPQDLYINIRSGDVFVSIINPNYAQPPLCFYQKIINENNYNKIFIVSNGHENPVVDELLKLYPDIKYFHGKVEKDISLIVNAFNLVMPVSTFPMTLIWLNKNLINLYVYEIINYNLLNVNYTIHKMKPSFNYRKVMHKKWNNSKEQLDLMLNEKCINSNITTIYPNKPEKHLLER